MRYVKKPIPVEAVFLDCPATGVRFLRGDELVVISQNALHIKTPEGVMRAKVGSCYLVRNTIHGEVRPVRKDIFESTYEAEAEVVA